MNRRLQIALNNVLGPHRHRMSRKYILNRGLMWGSLFSGMAVSFGPQLYAPWPKGGAVWLLQSFGFGMLFAAYSVFMSKTFNGLLKDWGQGNVSTKFSDKVIFWMVLPFYAYTWYLISTNSAQVPMLANTAAITMMVLFACGEVAKDLKDAPPVLYPTILSCKKF